jgi:hypothetical protein
MELLIIGLVVLLGVTTYLIYRLVASLEPRP